MEAIIWLWILIVVSSMSFIATILIMFYTEQFYFKKKTHRQIFQTRLLCGALLAGSLIQCFESSILFGFNLNPKTKEEEFSNFHWQIISLLKIFLHVFCFTWITRFMIINQKKIATEMAKQHGKLDKFERKLRQKHHWYILFLIIIVIMAIIILWPWKGELGISIDGIFCLFSPRKLSFLNGFFFILPLWLMIAISLLYYKFAKNTLSEDYHLPPKKMNELKQFFQIWPVNFLVFFTPLTLGMLLGLWFDQYTVWSTLMNSSYVLISLLPCSIFATTITLRLN